MEFAERMFPEVGFEDCVTYYSIQPQVFHSQEPCSSRGASEMIKTEDDQKPPRSPDRSNAATRRGRVFSISQSGCTA